MNVAAHASKHRTWAVSVIQDTFNLQAPPLTYARIIVVTLLALALWGSVVVAGVLFGWWRQPVAPTGDAQAFMRAAIEMIEQGNRGNAALVLIEDGAIW